MAMTVFKHTNVDTLSSSDCPQLPYTTQGLSTSNGCSCGFQNKRFFLTVYSHLSPPIDVMLSPAFGECH